MYLKYLGKRQELTLAMPTLVGGPYYIDGPGAVIQVDPVDGADLLRENGRMFSEADPPKQPVAPPKTKGDYVCEVCFRSYLTKSGLRRHMLAVHGDE